MIECSAALLRDAEMLLGEPMRRECLVNDTDTVSALYRGKPDKLHRSVNLALQITISKLFSAENSVLPVIPDIIYTNNEKYSYLFHPNGYECMYIYIYTTCISNMHYSRWNCTPSLSSTKSSLLRRSEQSKPVSSMASLTAQAWKSSPSSISPLGKAHLLSFQMPFNKSTFVRLSFI